MVRFGAVFAEGGGGVLFGRFYFMANFEEVLVESNEGLDKFVKVFGLLLPKRLIQ